MWQRQGTLCVPDVHRGSIPTSQNNKEFPKSNGWPEWFSRGWTLQEMIASSSSTRISKRQEDAESRCNTDSSSSGAYTDEQTFLSSTVCYSKPCPGQAIERRVEDRVHSLCNGSAGREHANAGWEVKKALHRLQLEVIRTSNDQRICVLCTRTQRSPRSCWCPYLDAPWLCNVESKMANLETPLHERRNFKSIQM